MTNLEATLRASQSLSFKEASNDAQRYLLISSCKAALNKEHIMPPAVVAAPVHSDVLLEV